MICCYRGENSLKDFSENYSPRFVVMLFCWYNLFQSDSGESANVYFAANNFLERWKNEKLNFFCGSNLFTQIQKIMKEINEIVYPIFFKGEVIGTVESFNQAAKANYILNEK